MTEPFIGMIALFSFNFAPRGWAICQEQLLSIAQNSALFSLLGTTYCGDGQTTFALPDLRGRVPLGQGQGPGLSGYQIDQQAGSENVTITANQMPQHTHTLGVSDAPATTANPVGNVLAVVSATDGDGIAITVSAYGLTANGAANSSAINPAGGSQPLPVMRPYMAMNYCIALEGIFPSRN